MGGGEAMTRSTRLLRVLAVAPGLLASTLLTLPVLAWLPAPAGLAVCLGGLTVMVLLGAGRLEDPAVRWLHGGRAATSAEAALLGPAVAVLCGAGVGPPPVSIRVAGRDEHRVAARAVGRRCVLVTAGLVRAVHRGRLPADQAAAIIAAAVGRHHTGATRFDLAGAFWLLPWRLVSAVASGVGRSVAALPLVGFAWRVRVVVATVAVVQSVTAGHPAVGMVVAVFVTLTYLAPRWRQAAERRTQLAADRFVIEHGLADPLSRVLRRARLDPGTLERIRGLAGPARRPALSLVVDNTTTRR
jgi:hypothetical protein